MTLLKHVATVRVSNVDKKSYEGELPVRLCNYTDVYYGDILTPASRDYMVATASAEQVRNFRLQAGDTVLTKDSETAEDIGVSAYIEASASDFVCGYHLAVLRPNRQELSPKYLFWSVRSSAAREQLAVAATGVTRFGLRAEAIASMVLRLPAPEEQQRIADFLDSQIALLDRAITLRQRQLELAAQNFRAAVDAALARSQGEVRMKYLCQGPGQYGLNVPASEYVDESAGVRMVRTTDLSGGSLSAAESGIYVPPPVPAEHLLEAGDVLVSRAGTVGRAFLVPREAAGLTFAGFLVRFRPKMSTDPRFLLYALGSTQVQAQVQQGAITSTIQNFNAERYENLRLPAVDPLRVVEMCDSLDEASRLHGSAEAAIAGGLRLLQERKEALITAAVTGEFDVTTARSVA